MKLKSLIIIILIGFTIVLPTNSNNGNTHSMNQNELVVIRVIAGNKYNETKDIQLTKGTQYNITFVNELLGEFHNLVLFEENKNPNVNNIDKANKIVNIGPQSPIFSPESKGGINKRWSYLWTTSLNDSWVKYGCSYIGHFSNENGWFRIGNPGQKPGSSIFDINFDFLYYFLVIFIIIVIIFIWRKR